MRLEDDGVTILSSMIGVEQFLTEGLKRLNDDLACDNNVRNLRIGIIFLSCINRLQANES